MTGIRSAYRGGPLDGKVDMLPSLDDGPARSLTIESIDLAILYAAVEQGEGPEVAVTGRMAGEYRWMAHVEPLDGPAFEEYLWREGGH